MIRFIVHNHCDCEPVDLYGQHGPKDSAQELDELQRLARHISWQGQNTECRCGL